MELQGSNIFMGSNRVQFPPASEQNQSSFNNQQMSADLSMKPDYGNLNLGNSHNPLANGYQTEDIFASASNPFIETLRSLALNPSQINTLLSALPASGAPFLQPAQT